MWIRRTYNLCAVDFHRDPTFSIWTPTSLKIWQTDWWDFKMCEDAAAEFHCRSWSDLDKNYGNSRFQESDLRTQQRQRTDYNQHRSYQ